MDPQYQIPGVPQNQPQVAMPGQPMQAAQPMQQPTVLQQPTQQMPQNPFAQPNPQPNQNMANLGATAINAKQAAPVSPNAEAPTSTQSTLLISEIRDNMVIMKDGSFRAVVACKSINFDLMSDTEREGVEYSYQNFLNSLKFDIQILVRSQRVDIAPYINKLANIRRDTDNMLLGILMDDYINFIDILAQEANIMDKSFFIVVPYHSSLTAEKFFDQTKNFFKAFKKDKGQSVTRIDRATYEKATSELNNRVDSIISGLFQIGVQSVRLNTKELGELYYNFNNPDTAVNEPLVDFANVATMYVKGGGKQNG